MLNLEDVTCGGPDLIPDERLNGAGLSKSKVTSLVTSIDDLFIKYEKVYRRSCGSAL